jgi:hypothetical protein
VPAGARGKVPARARRRVPAGRRRSAAAVVTGGICLIH